MKLIKAFIITWAFSAQAGLPPTTLSGDQAATKPTTFSTLVPNNQATQISGTQSRIETSNTNLLVNPSFEHSTVTTGWSATGVTPSAETSIVVDGKKSLKLVLTGVMSAFQDSTINAAQLSGLQGVGSAKIKNNGVADLQACIRSAGAVVTSLCVNVPNDNTWKHISIPFIMNGTSNGLALISTTGTTGTVYVDDAFVGTSAPFQNVNGAKFLGSVTISGCTADYTGSSTTLASFSAATNCTVTTSGQATNTNGTGTISTTPKIQFLNMPAGEYRIEAEGRLGQSVTGQATYFKFSDGTTTARELSTIANGGNSIFVPTANQSFTYNTNQTNVTWDLRYLVSSGGTAFVGNQTVHPLTIKVWYFPPESKIYSQGGDIVSNSTVYSATVTTSGVVARESVDWINGNCTLATNFTCNFNTGVFTTTPVCSISPEGGYVTNASYSVSAGSITWASTISGVGNNLQAVDIICVKQGNDYSNSFKPVIVGSFAGLEKCANDYECTDTFSAQISSAGVVSNENLDWISGNCTNANPTVCTLNSNLKDGTSALSSAMNCTLTLQSTGSTAGMVTTNTTSSIAITMYDTVPRGTLSLAPFVLKCQKGANDYKPKTAKIASSIGVPTVPGVVNTGTGNAIDTFSFSYGTTNATTVCSASPCSYLDQIGSIVTSITRTGVGNYTLNIGKTYSKLKCQGNAKAPASSFGTVAPMQCSSCSSLAFVTENAGTTIDTIGTIYCQGSY